MNNFGVFMSYCRQENTNKAIIEALEQVENALDCNGGTKLSKHEAKEFSIYVNYMIDWLQQMALLNEDGDVDDEQMENLIIEITD